MSHNTYSKPGFDDLNFSSSNQTSTRIDFSILILREQKTSTIYNLKRNIYELTRNIIFIDIHISTKWKLIIYFSNMLKVLVMPWTDKKVFLHIMKEKLKFEVLIYAKQYNQWPRKKKILVKEAYTVTKMNYLIYLWAPEIQFFNLLWIS